MRLFIIFLVCIISGCVTPNKIPTSMMEPSLQYRGFSVERPSDPGWYMLHNEQHPLEALFRIETESETHTVHTSIRLSKIPKQPVSISELKEIVDKNYLGSIDGSKYVLVSYKSNNTLKQNQWCVQFDLIFWSHVAMNSDQPLLMSMKGYVVLHPEWKRTVVTALYSERGNEKKLDGKFEESGKAIIESVIIESSPGNPV